MLAPSRDWTSDSTERSATSMRTSSRSLPHVDSFTFSTRHARSTSTEYARFHSTYVGCDTSAARRSGAWPSTPTATNAMSRAHSPTVPSTALLKRGSKSVPRTWVRDQVSLALDHGRSGLPNITLQRSDRLALLACRPMSVRVRPRSADEHLRNPLAVEVPALRRRPYQLRVDRSHQDPSRRDSGGMA